MTENPPFHLVNPVDGKHIGPFSSMTDALLARAIGEGGWARAEIMDKKRFTKHLKRT